MFTPPARFCPPGEQWPPFVSQRVDEIGNVSYTCAQLSLHIRLYACEPRPIGLHFSRPHLSHIVCENLEAIKSVFVETLPNYWRLLGL